MHHFRITALRFITRFLILVCLAFATSGIAFSQSDPEVRISDVTLIEGDDPQVQYASEPVEISLSAPSTKDVKVTISTQPGTAESDVDFSPVNGVELTIPAGQRSILVSAAHTKGDTIVEGTEWFFLNLSNPVNATIADGQAVATIIDDDAPILLTQTSSTRAAALDSVLFTKETFPVVNTLNFSSDNRTRISVFAVGLKFSSIGTPPPLSATAEDPQGTVFPLTVEFFDRLPVGNTPKTLSWLTQVILKMPEPNLISTPEDLKIRITSGQTSNAVLVNVKPQ